MKEQISITVDKEIIEQINSTLKDGIFRNKSHVFEFAVKKLLENGQ